MINVDLFNFINHNLQNSLFDIIMPFITYLGGFDSLLIICAAVFVLAILFNNDDYKKITLLCLVSLLIAGGIAVLLKNMFMEPRPFMTLSNVHLLVSENDPNSFPSGHTTSTVAVLGVLIFKYKDKLLRAILIICCFLVAFSRIYCGVHYPLDVVTGAIIGTVVSYLIYSHDDKIIHIYNKIGVMIGVKK